MENNNKIQAIIDVESVESGETASTTTTTTPTSMTATSALINTPVTSVTIAKSTSSSHMTRSASSSSFKLGSSSLASSSTNASSAPTKFFGQRSLRSSDARLKYAKDENNNYLSTLSHRKGFYGTVVKVRKWEKRLVAIDNSTLVLYRWVPVVANDNASFAQINPSLN